jgi:hypothetical protein
MRQQFALVLAVAVLAGVGLTGCDDEDDQSPPAAAHAQAIVWVACPAPAVEAPKRDGAAYCSGPGQREAGDHQGGNESVHS